MGRRKEVKNCRDLRSGLLLWKQSILSRKVRQALKGVQPLTPEMVPAKALAMDLAALLMQSRRASKRSKGMALVEKPVVNVRTVDALQEKAHAKTGPNPKWSSVALCLKLLKKSSKKRTKPAVK